MSGAAGATAVLDEAEVRMAERRAKRCEDAITELELPALVALAGAPFWTIETMGAAGLDFAKLAETARPLVRREGDGDDATLTFDRDALGHVQEWMRDARTTRKTASTFSPAPVLADLGDRVASLGDAAPPVLRRWAELAASLRRGPDQAAEELLARIRQHCDAGELGEATELIEASGPLAQVIGGPLAVAERVARHRVERGFRLARDRRSLSFFVGRDEAMAAFRRLLDDEGPWALHYVGVGGAGKTTFIRHLAVDRARDLGLTVARIDFDYLSPAYPGRDPGQLVQALVHELTVQIDRAEQDRWLQSIHEQLDRLRSVAREVAADDPLGPIAWPEFQELLSFVGSFLHSLGRPLIILDTCEELMKLAPVAGTIPSVEATFRLIEELHQRVPQLRVLFAGRRLLAAGGDGWEASAQGRTQALSQPRPYLALCELRGMTGAEADEVLARLLPETRRGDRPLIDAILAACPEDDRITGLRDPAAGGAPRYSPFRVVRFARWVVAEPAITVDRLGEGTDPYIEQRIVQRMGALEELLPYVALLRRFDAAMLAEVSGRSPGEAAATLRALAGHEWIELYDLAGRGDVVEAKASVREPLEAYLAGQRPVPWHAARRAIGEALAGRFHLAGAVRLPPELIDAALRTMPEDDAVKNWFRLERHIEDDWGSALILTRFLLGEHNAAASPHTLLGAAVRATHASALIHQQPEVDVGELWEQIHESASALEPVEVVRMMRSRARLGMVAATAWRGGDDVDVDDLRGEIDAAVAAIGARGPAVAKTWIVAAVEALIERMERDGSTCDGVEALVSSDDFAFAAPEPGLRAWIAVLRARVHALLGDEAAVRTALDAAVDAPDWTLPPTNVDWLAPPSLEIRVRLEAVRLRFYDAQPFDPWIEAMPGERDGEVDDDGDRLVSALLSYTAARRTAAPVARPVRHRTWGLREPAVFRRFPPAAVVVEQLRVDQDDIIGELSDGDRSRIMLARARRRREPGLLPALAAQTADDRLVMETQQASAVVLARSLGMSSRQASSGPTDVLDDWSHQRAISLAELEDGVRAMRPRLGGLIERTGGTDWIDVTRAMVALGEVIELSRYTTAPLAAQFETLETAGPPQHPDRRELVLRLQLRLAAPQVLDLERVPRELKAAVEVVPALVGRLALEEGELLSLRFPDRARHLFDFAVLLLAQTGDELHAEAAMLASRICDRTLGKPATASVRPFGLPSSLVVGPSPVLADLARRVADPEAEFPELERGQPRDPRARDRAQAWWRRRSDDVAGWAYVVLGLLIIGGIGYGLWFVVDRFVLPWLRQYVQLPESRLTTLAGVLVLVTAAYRLIKAISSELASTLTSLPLLWRRRRFRAELRLWPGPRGVTVNLERRDGLSDWNVRMPRPGEKPSLAATTADDAGKPALRSLRHDVAKFAPRLALVRAEVARSLGPFVWEAPLVAGLPQLVVWRAVEQHALPAKIASESHFDERVVGVWQRHTRDVIHLIGRARRTAAGIDLGEGVRLFTGADVVLQLEPQDYDQASTATRTELGILRELASTLIERGARSVIVIPAVAHDELIAVVKVLARAMGAAPARKLERLAEAVRLTRAHIAAIPHGDHLVIADEITLFVGESPPS